MFKRKLSNTTSPQETENSYHDLTQAFKPLIAELQSLVGVTQNDFQRLYVKTLSQFVGFIAKPNQPADGSAIKQVLQQVVLALKKRRGLLLPLGADSEVAFRERELWTYAVFIAVLFHELDSYERLNLAKALMPTEGFAWLHRHTDIFQQLSNYLGDQNQTIFHSIIGQTATLKQDRPLMDKAIIQETKAAPTQSIETKAPVETKQTISKTNTATIKAIRLDELNQDKTPESPPETKEKHSNGTLPEFKASDIWEWLKSALTHEAIAVNHDDSVIHGVEAGIFLRIPETIQLFLKTQAEEAGIHGSNVLAQCANLTRQLKADHHLINDRHGARIHRFCLGEWQKRQLLSGIVIPQAMLTDSPIPINTRLSTDPIEDVEP